MSEEHRIVSVYGVGGQGKSSLLDEFRRTHLGTQVCIYPWAYLDLNSPENREPPIALLKIRNQLRRFGLDTPTFDIAFARWHQLERPGRELKADYPEFFDDRQGVIEDLADVAGELIAEIPGGGLVFKVLSRLSERYKEWSVRSHSILATLDEFTSSELIDYLPIYFGH